MNATLNPYAPPRSDKPIDLRLDANEGRPLPRELVAPAVDAAFSIINRYPTAAALEARLAEQLGVAPARVVVTAGGDDALDRTCRAFLSPGTAALLTSPTFEMIPRYARAAGATLTELPWARGPFPTQPFIDAVSPATSLAFIVTPNNPTGAAAGADDIHAVADALGDRPLCVDLAYTEYADVDLTTAVTALPNTIGVRTLSKAWGLAGLRVGYAVAAEPLATRLRAAGGPFPTSALSLAIAQAALDAATPFMLESVALARRERAQLALLLRSLGVACDDSQANFVLARFNSCAHAWTVADKLAGRAIGVRRFREHTATANALRIGCPCDNAAYERLAASLRAVISETST